MKKHLLSAAILAVAASSAMAVNGPFAFSWGPTAVGNTAVTVANIPGAIPGVGEALIGVQVSFSGTVFGQVTVSPGNATTATANLFGNHILAFDGFNPVDIDALNATSPATFIGGGASATLLTTSAPIGPGGTTVANLANFLNPPNATVPVTIRFQGALGVDVDPSTLFSANPQVVSSGSGFVTYIVQTGVPEAETYVAGLALVGLVGFSFYRRSVRA